MPESKHYSSSTLLGRLRYRCRRANHALPELARRILPTSAATLRRRRDAETARFVDGWRPAEEQEWMYPIFLAIIVQTRDGIERWDVFQELIQLDVSTQLPAGESNYGGCLIK
ncbi:hypothetical protein ACJZ2D_010391 [Fusarium nematophilum]